MTDFDTVFPADTVEFAPHPDALDIFACGTYKLEDSQGPSTTTLTSEENTPTPQSRRGQCLVFQVDPLLPVGNQGFKKIQAFDLPAVLDMKWCHRSPSVTPILGIADSEGNITLHEWKTTERVLTPLSATKCASPDTLCLSMDWSNRRTPGSDLGSLIVSLSNGSLCLLRSHDAHSLSICNSWHAHDHEPWVAAWNYWNPNVVYSGGDDLKMKSWDIRQGCLQPLFINHRFDGGITSIQSNPHTEHLIAVGSYDNTVKLFDTRNPLIPLVAMDVGGGAWRVKWHPSPARRNDLLVACMHDGFKIVRYMFDRPESPCGEILKRFDAHKSLAYGADWSFSADQEDKTLIGSCSFYDHKLHLWSG